MATQRQQESPRQRPSGQHARSNYPSSDQHERSNYPDDAPRRRSAQRNPAPRQRYDDSPRRGAHARRPAHRRRSALPVVLAVVALIVVGVGGFFAFRSCSSSGAEQAQGGPELAAGASDQTTETKKAKKTSGKNDDGSVDINLMMVGDILFHYQVRQSGLKDDGSRNYDHLFEHVLDELEDQDVKVLNQETPIAGPIYTGDAPDGYDGYPQFNGPQEVGDAEAKAGFNVVLKATNHAMDNGSRFDDHYKLVKAEQSFWADQHPEVAVIGEVDPDDESTSVEDVYVYEKEGFKVALLNYTFDLNGNPDPKGAVSMLEEDHVRSTMAKAREEADMIVVFPHWGEEYSLEPVEDQYYWADILMEEGADVIIGNHPHVMEPVQILTGPDGKHVPCYWSTGNFVSTSPSDESLVGGMAKVVLHKDADGECSVTSVQFKPLVSHLGMGDDMTTYMVTDWTDELAASNWLNTDINPNTDNTTLTPEWANEFCSKVLGRDYDVKKGVLELDPKGTTSIASTTDASKSSKDKDANKDTEKNADKSAGKDEDSASSQEYTDEEVDDQSLDEAA